MLANRVPLSYCALGFFSSFLAHKLASRTRAIKYSDFYDDKENYATLALNSQDFEELMENNPDYYKIMLYFKEDTISEIQSFEVSGGRHVTFPAYDECVELPDFVFARARLQAAKGHGYTIPK